VVRDVEVALEDFHQVNSAGGQHVEGSMIIHKERWTTPLANMIKINCDAAIDTKKRIIGMGIIARDGRGFFMAVASKVMNLVDDLVVAETLAALHALLFSRDLGFQNAIFTAGRQ
jgi:hypothetical protein